MQMKNSLCSPVCLHGNRPQAVPVESDPAATLPSICPPLTFGRLARSNGQWDGNVTADQTTQGLLVVCYHGNVTELELPVKLLHFTFWMHVKSHIHYKDETGTDCTLVENPFKKIQSGHSVR